MARLSLPQKIGSAISAVGLSLMLYYLVVFDPTVDPTIDSYPNRIYNTGRLNTRLGGIIAGAALLLAGLVPFAVAAPGRVPVAGAPVFRPESDPVDPVILRRRRKRETERRLVAAAVGGAAVLVLALGWVAWKVAGRVTGGTVPQTPQPGDFWDAEAREKENREIQRKAKVEQERVRKLGPGNVAGGK